MRRLTVVSALVASCLLAACGSSDSSSADTSAAASSTIAVPVTIAGTAAPTTSTTVAPTTTVVESTTTAATTTTLEPAATSTVAPPTTDDGVADLVDLVLSDSGIGPIPFGTPAAAAVDQLATLLGAPTEDRAAAFPTADGSGSFIDDNDVAFAQPFGRFVCFPNELCVSFGGPTADALVFLGWHYQHDAAPIPPDLFTAAGLGIGVRWSDHLDDITMSSGASCYSVGYGSAGGISVALVSAGAPFGAFDDSGVYVETTPPADQVTVMSMTAGENEFFLFGDC
jgi:hypothetical protein